MKWSELFNVNDRPSMEDIRHFLGEAQSTWYELTSYIEEEYQIKPEMSYSKCSAQPGWNIKYKKSGKSLCTLYPMKGFFIALIVVGAKEEEETERMLEADIFTPYLKELYRKTAFSAGGRWLMIEVKNKETINDIKVLISIRVRSRKKIKKKL
ncbi:DUF3788 domain-containing protein [Neobacillus sp. LXY-4]|uniref:DUF3788 domain-containing protein n=1 Tax=Neobacillus sp. LXY-4 TaxID=3379826 RepID=UPI003EE0B682